MLPLGFVAQIDEDRLVFDFLFLESKQNPLAEWA